MSLAITYSRAQIGIAAPLVTVETHISNGLARFSIVGLPETAVKESKERVRSALLTSNFDFPIRRITINLAPADLPKEGGGFDLAIAIGILVASKQLRTSQLAEYEFLSELALSGELRAITRVLPCAIATRKKERQLIVAKDNAIEASFVPALKVLPAQHLTEVFAHLNQNQIITPQTASKLPPATPSTFDFKYVYGQQRARRALEIAAAGGHNVLFVGPPGSGKTLLANCLAGILPPLSAADSLEVAAIYALSKTPRKLSEWHSKPFRSPHHTASNVALVGGGNPPHPGEVSLAHQGVLFLDELPEFNRRALESLREPLEAGKVSIARAAKNIIYPAKFQLIAAMNPCPCGHYGNPQQECRCSNEQIERYQQRLSGPFLDRIDMIIEVPALNHDEFIATTAPEAESSKAIAHRVAICQHHQTERHHSLNSRMHIEQIQQYCRLAPPCQTLLNQANNKWRFSTRSYHRLLKVARTIADLECSENLQEQHLAESIVYQAFSGNTYLK